MHAAAQVIDLVKEHQDDRLAAIRGTLPGSESTRRRPFVHYRGVRQGRYPRIVSGLRKRHLAPILPGFLGSAKIDEIRERKRCLEGTAKFGGNMARIS